MTALNAACAIDDPTRFRRSRNVAVYFGLTSKRWQSGTAIDVKGRISKVGDGDVWRSLYEAAAVMLKRFKGKDAIKSWGLKIAKRRCHSRFRRGARIGSGAVLTGTLTGLHVSQLRQKS